MHINTIEHALAIGQIGRGKRKAGRNSASIHVAANLELIGQLRNGAVEALLLLGRGNFREYQLLAKNCLNLVLNKVELINAVGINRNVKAKAEELFRANL